VADFRPAAAFHEGIEPLSRFVRRNFIFLAAMCIAFSAGMLYVIFSVDAAYYYPHIVTDQLLYHLKALAFIHQGTTEARAAVNAGPFPYNSGPGLLRAPLIAMSSEFDVQLRAIQVSNIFLGLAQGILSAYVLSWITPRRFDRWVIAYAFAMLVLTPVWVTNVTSLLTDLPHAVASLASLIACVRLAQATTRSSRLRWGGVFLLFAALSYAFRFTGLAVAIFAVSLLRTTWGTGLGLRAYRKYYLMAAGLIALLIIVSFRTLKDGYAWVPYFFLTRTNPYSIILNFLALAVPSQVVPGFELVYRHFPLALRYDATFFASGFDTAVTLAGLSITAAVLYGAWLERKRLRPEILLLLLVTPVFATVIQSTSRYFLAYQPLFWMFAFAALKCIAEKLPRFQVSRTLRLAALAAVLAVGAGAVYLRARSITGTEKLTLSNFSLGRSRRHAGDVAATYRSLRNYIESLDPQKSLIVGGKDVAGKWWVIAGRKSYQLDRNIADAVKARDVYLVITCPTPSDCAAFDNIDRHYRDRIDTYGRVGYVRTFEHDNPYASARVYRLTAAR
jgi:hypothetical protein